MSDDNGELISRAVEGDRRAAREEIRIILNADLERLPPDYEKVVRL